MRIFLLSFLFVSLLGSGQTRSPQKPAPQKAGKPATGTVKGKPGQKKDQQRADSSDVYQLPDTVDWRDHDIRISGEFAVYSKKHNGRDKRMKLCIQLTGDTVLNQCFVDSICRNPEFYKELFRKKEGDTTYVLLYVDAFTKGIDKPCDGGHETKVFFIRWNTERNKAIFKQKTIASCARAIHNMSKADVKSWDQATPLVFEYNKGLDFYELTFDPSNYKKGLQTGIVGESPSEDGQQRRVLFPPGPLWRCFTRRGVYKCMSSGPFRLHP